MAKLVMVLGGSGQGKSTSIRNLDPKKTCLIRAIKKDLPFENARNWLPYTKEGDKHKEGTMFTTDSSEKIVKIISGIKDSIGANIIVIDDFQYIMANEFMRRASETGFGKFNDIGYNAWAIIKTASELADNMRVYFLWHPDFEDDGRLKAKTVGKVTDRYVTPEGYFPICLGAFKDEGKGYFRTNSASAMTPYKSPMGMFEEVIPNDLEVVDKRICEYYGIKEI